MWLLMWIHMPLFYWASKKRRCRHKACAKYKARAFFSSPQLFNTEEIRKEQKIDGQCRTT